MRGDEPMKPIDNQTRKNIIAAKERKENRGDIARWFNVSISAIDRIWKRYKETGSFLPKPYTGRQSSTSKETDDKIRETIKNKPDMTLEELIDELSLNLTPSGLHRKVQRMGLTYKKKRFSLKNKNSQMFKQNVRNGQKVNLI